MRQQQCHECNAWVYKLYPHPQDETETTMVCEDCEYAIMAKYSQEIPDPDEPQDYGSKTHGF